MPMQHILPNKCVKMLLHFVYLGFCDTFLLNEFISIFSPSYLCCSDPKTEYEKQKG